MIVIARDATYLRVQFLHQAPGRANKVPYDRGDLFRAVGLARRRLETCIGAERACLGGEVCRRFVGTDRGNLATRLHDGASGPIKHKSRLDARFLGEPPEGLLQRIGACRLSREDVNTKHPRLALGEL